MKKLDLLLQKLSKKVDAFEILKKDILRLSVTVEKGNMENFKESEETLYSLRIIKNKRMGFTYFTSVYNVDDILDNVIPLGEIADFDENNGFYNNEYEENDFNLFNLNIDEITINQMKDFSLRLEELSYQKDKRIINVKDSGFFRGKATVEYINSNFVFKKYTTNYCGASVTVVSKDGSSSMVGYEYNVSKKFDFSPESIAHSAVNKAVRMLNAKKGGQFGKIPVIIENELVSDILSIIAPSFFIENIIKNKSMFTDLQDKNIGFEGINLLDDGTNPDCIGSALFDDEGTPTCRKYLIKKGMLNEFLYNYYYARKENKNFAGNGFADSFKTVPTIDFTNLILEPSETDLSLFINSLNNGLLITNLMGLHMADPISGDFSLGAEGILIEKGEFANPVKEFVISGNILEILRNCKTVFNDVKRNGRIIAPSILVEGLNIVGN